MNELKIQFPTDFESRYSAYKAKVMGQTINDNLPLANEISKLPDKNKLQFFPDSGIIEFQNKVGETKSGQKDYSLLSVFSKSKNTTFNINEICEYCNPLVNKDTHKFRGEKDIDDTIRQIRFKLKVNKNSFFPIQKKGGKSDKKWIWIEK